MSTIAAVIWDMDGVLVDTKEYHVQSWQQSLALHNIPMTEKIRKILDKTFGQHSKKILKQVLAPRYDEALADSIIKQKTTFFREIVEPLNIDVMPGVRDLLEEFTQQGILQAIASSAPRDNIDLLVKKVRITEYFEGTIVSGAGLPSKPEPDVFQKAAELLKVTPRTCIVIEDMNDGAKAAHAAGMLCIAVLTSQTEKQLKDADWCIATLDEVTADKILQWGAEQVAKGQV